MAQTTASMSAKNISVAYSTDGTNFNDFSGYSGSIAVTGGDITSSEFYTFDGANGIPVLGKGAPYEITVSVVYTEEATGPFLVLLPYKLAGSSVSLRWSPRGLESGTTGESIYTTDHSYSRITQLPYPGGEANSGVPITMDMVVRCASITRTTTTA